MRFVWYCLAVVSVALVGCGGNASQTSSVDSEDGLVPIEMESSDADRLLKFYFGGFVGPEGGDPIEAGILEKREKTWFLRNEEAWTGALSATARSYLKDLLTEAAETGSVSESMLESFVGESYYSVRPFPGSLDSLIVVEGSWAEPEWFRVSLKGSMVPLDRITWVRRTHIESALDRMDSLSDEVIYDTGTLFVGEHENGDSIVETTFMRKRADGFWDFWAYGASGELVDRVRKEPRDMLIPTRCTGCHYGDRQFEPERSYPGEARPGPRGARAFYIPSTWRSAELASALQEHARRSDTILGLYATLYLAEAASSDSGASAYLEKFGIDSMRQ